LVLEYAEMGSLWDLMTRKVKLSEDELKNYIKQIVEGIEYLHTMKHKIIHRDLKVENILITIEGKIKLADFGMSFVYSDTSSRKSKSGTFGYLPPEMFEG